MCILRLAMFALLLAFVKGRPDGLLDLNVHMAASYLHGEAKCHDTESPISVECTVKYPGLSKYVALVPNVEWLYKELNGTAFTNLFNIPRYRPGVEIAQACTKIMANGDVSFHCKYEHSRACSPDYDGAYMCNIHVEFNNGDLGFYNATSHISSAFNFGEYDTDCFFPKVTDFRARLSFNSTIFLQWNTTSIPPNKVYCDRSRRFSVKILTYNDFYAYLGKLSSLTSDFINTTKRRDTNFTLHLNASYTVRKFYVFLVRNQHKRGPDSVLTDTNIYDTEVFYFGGQELLTLVKPVHSVEKRSVLLGSLVELLCEASGFPLPTVTMWFENNLIEPMRPSIQVPRVSRNRVADRSFAGRYQCNAVGYYLSPHGGAFLHSTVKYIDVEVYEEDSSTDILCTTSAPSKCTKFLSGRTVLLNMTRENLNFQGLTDGMVSTLESIANSSDAAAQRCLEAAQAVVCHSSYPFCFDHDNSRKVCKTTCDLFRSGGPCASSIDPRKYPGILSVIFSNCDSRTDTAGDSPECIHVPFGDVQSSQEPSWCSVGRGTGYAGNIKFTSSGNLCQDWIQQLPHQHATYSGDDIHGAVNQCRNPEGRGTRPWCYTVDPDVRWEYCDSVPQCEICTHYTETFCKALPGYHQSGLVYVNRHESEWNERGLDGAELWMNREWHRLRVPEFNLSSSCLLELRELICHRTLPLCGNSPSQGGTVESLRICSDHCKASKLFKTCPGDLVSKLETDMQLDRVTFSKLECDVDTKENADTCLTSQAFLLVTANLATEDNTCYQVSNHGQAYNGTVSVTKSGKRCHPWGSLLPGAENYCRNPGQVTSRPWCYTGSTTWELCDIPVCKTITEPLIATALVGLSSYAIAMVVFFILLGFSIILSGMFIAAAVVYIRRRKMRKRSIRKMNSVSSRWDYVRNTMYAKVEERLSPSNESKLKKDIESFPQYDKSAIHYVRQIGQGNFGVVFFAKAEGVLPDEKVTEVAVKTLKEESCTEALEDFVREAKLMFSFDHENIVKIFGVAMENVPYYLIFEYMDKGDLAHFLRENASSAQRRLMAPFDGRPRSRTESTLSNEPSLLSSEHLRDICKQIASGMQYLAEKNHIHRDLACRNCLVKSCDREQTDSSLVIKIGDFGMSHNLYSADYYRVKGSAILPVRWMSPEAIIYGKFSAESDVWSFGVVMWEVFSFAMQPYYGTSNEEVTEAIRRHKILKQPTDCSSSMYEIMKQCWNLQANLRPSFEELYNQLDEFRASVSSGGSHSIDYFNSNSSDIDSDAFLEENSVDDMDATI